MISSGDFRRRVAVKLLHADVARNRGAAMRMRDEARILGHLAHRHIVSVIDLIKLGERWAVVMDYVPGADLEQVLGRCIELSKPTPPGVVFEVGAAVALALDAAWSSDDGEGRPLRVVHRDIKPSNVRLTPDGDVKVLDFGVARVDMEHREAATREAGWIGTERYMAPERIMMLGDTPAGDVYALGASLVELLLGVPLGRTPVLTDRHQTFLDEAMAKVRGRLSSHPATDEVVETLRATLHHEPQERPQAKALAATFERLARRLGGPSLRAFSAEIVPPLIASGSAEAVDQVLTEAGVHPSRVDADASSGATLDALALSTQGPAPESPRGGSSLGLLVGGGVTLVVVLAVGLLALAAIGGVLWWQLGGSRTPVAVSGDEPTTEDPSGQASASGVEGSASDGEGSAVAPSTSTSTEASPEPPTALDDEPSADGDRGDADEPAAAGTSEDSSSDPPSSAPSSAAPDPEKVARPSSPPDVTKPASAAIDPDAPRVRAAKFIFTEGSSLSVVCGDVRASGTTSVAMRAVPAGSCTVRGVWLGTPLTTTFELQRPSEVHCKVHQEALSCAAR